MYLVRERRISRTGEEYFHIVTTTQGQDCENLRFFEYKSVKARNSGWGEAQLPRDILSKSAIAGQGLREGRVKMTSNRLWRKFTLFYVLAKLRFGNSYRTNVCNLRWRWHRAIPLEATPNWTTRDRTSRQPTIGPQSNPRWGLEATHTDLEAGHNDPCEVSAGCHDVPSRVASRSHVRVAWRSQGTNFKTKIFNSVSAIDFFCGRIPLLAG